MGNKDSTPRNDIQDITHEKSTSECHISDKSTLSCNKITKVENGIGDTEESVKKAIKLAHASSCAVQTHKLPGETKESFDIPSNSETALESIQLEAANLANVNSDFIFNDKLNATSNDDMEKNTIAIENKLPEESVNIPMQSIDIYSDALAYLPIDEIKKMVNFPTVCDRPLKTMQSEAKHIPDLSHSDPLTPTLTLVPTEAVKTNVIASDEILDIANNIYLSSSLPSCCETCPESSRNLGDEHCNLINPQHTVSINVTEATNDSNANTQFSDIDETTSVGNEMTGVYSNASDLSKYPLPRECNPDIFENGSNVFALIVSTDVFYNKNDQLKELSNNITETPVDSNINTQPDNMKEAINIVEKATELTSTTADLLQYSLPQEVKSACQESIALASMISIEDVPCNRSDELQQLFNNATGTQSDSSINIQPDNVTEETVSNAEEFMEVTETNNLLECSPSHKIKSESQENITLTPNSARDLSCSHSDEPQLTVGVTDATCGSNLNIQSSNSVEGTSNVVNKLTETTIAADLFGHSSFQELKSDLNENQVTVSSNVSSEDFPCEKNEIQQPHITINSNSESCLSGNHNTKQEGSSILIVDEKELAFDYSEDLLRASENVLQNAGYRELSPSSEAEAKQIALQINEDFLKFCNITELNRSPVLNNHSSTDPDVPVCCEEKSGHTPEITVVKKELFPYMLNDNAKQEIQEREIQNDINLFNGQTLISIENKTSQSSSEVVHDLLLPNCAAALFDKGSDELQILENAFDREPDFNTCSKLKMEMSGMERECIQQIQDPLERCLCTEIATDPQEALSTRTTNSSTEFPITASTQSDLESGLSHDTNFMAKDFNWMTDDSVPLSFSSENIGANSVGDFCGSVEIFQDSSAFDFLMKEDKSVGICPSQGRPSVISRFDPLVSGPGLTRIQNVKSLQPLIEFENSSNEITFECVDSTPSQVNKILTEEEFQNALKCHELQLEQSLIQLEKEHVNNISIIKHDIDCLLQHNVSLTDACDIMRNSINEGINFADAEFIKQKSCQIDAAIHRKNLIIERDQALEDLRNVEKAFSDLMTRYDNAKVALEQMKENQLVLKQKVETGMKENNEKQEKYNALHLQVDEKLNIINEDLIKFQKDHEAEKAAVTAMLRKSEIRVRSLTTTLNQTEKDKHELLRICEDFGYKKTM